VTERALLDAIVRDPDADEPRRVYADWLIEEGDPRGEFIQAQCALASADEELDDEKTRALRRRVRELLKEHRAAWLAPVKKIGLDPDCWTFERGFVAKVGGGAGDVLKAAKQLKLAPLLDAVSVWLQTAAELDKIVASPLGKRLRRLDLSSSKKHVGAGAAAARLPALVGLELEDTALGAEDVRAIAGRAQLRELAVRSCRLLKGALEPLAAARFRLRRLALPAAHAGAALGGWLASSKAIDGAVALQLAGNELGAEGVRRLLEADLRQLVELDLRGNGLGDADLKLVLENSEKRLPRLERLLIGGNPLGDGAAARLAAWAGAKRLTKLHAGGTKLTAAGVRALAASSKLSKLRSLVLSDVRLDDATTKLLLGSKHLAKARLYVGDRFLARS
jgi:uncharacterized protein (TIGR02996 family)